MNNFMKTFLAALLAFVVANILIGVFTFMIFAGLAASFSKAAPVVKENSVLRIDFSQPITDSPMNSPLDGFDFRSMKMNRSQTLYDVLGSIERAAADDRIKGIYLDMNTYGGMGTATLEEIRNALLTFKGTGKFIVSYADQYGQGAYYLATAGDKIYMNPEGGLFWMGLSSHVMFYKGLLEKLDLQPEVIRHGQFKAAVEPFILDKMSPENRLQTTTLVNSVWNNIVQNVAEARNIPVEQLQRYASQLEVVTDADKAVETLMVDELLYQDDVDSLLATLSERGGDENPEFISLGEYSLAAPAHSGKLSKNKVALVYAEGEIVDGEGERGQIGGASLAAKLKKVREDDKVKAVVLRVNSPGGSALASEVIWREIERIRQEKPVIVSMGNYAASGGYYISCPADAILASPGTLTGSIGVFGLMVNAEKTLRDKLGVTLDVVKTNASSDFGANLMGLSLRPLNPLERARLQQSVESVYETFIGHVAQGRNMTTAAVDSIGGGRVWSGASALENGLIDGFGGLKDAIALAADRAGIADDFRVSIASDGESSPFDMLFDMMASVKAGSMPIGENDAFYRAYLHLRHMLSDNGVQAVMPYRIEME